MFTVAGTPPASLDCRCCYRKEVQDLRGKRSVARASLAAAEAPATREGTETENDFTGWLSRRRCGTLTIESERDAQRQPAITGSETAAPTVPKLEFLP